MKDETHGIPIPEFVGHKSKIYSMIYEEKGKWKEKKTAKGIKNNVIKQNTKHDHYKECLFDKTVHMSTRSYNHQLYIITINILGLHSTINGTFSTMALVV